MLYYDLLQASFFLIALFASREEYAFTWPFRVITFYHDPKEDAAKKKELTKIFHRAGALCMAVMFLLSAVPAFYIVEGAAWWKVLNFCLWFITALLWYWLVFDIAYAMRLPGQKWHFLGTTAGTDIRVISLLGRNAGKKKAVICVALIIFINVIVK